MPFRPISPAEPRPFLSPSLILTKLMDVFFTKLPQPFSLALPSFIANSRGCRRPKAWSRTHPLLTPSHSATSLTSSKRLGLTGKDDSRTSTDGDRDGSAGLGSVAMGVVFLAGPQVRLSAAPSDAFGHASHKGHESIAGLVRASYLKPKRISVKRAL